MHARGFARPPKPFAKNCPIKAPLLLSGRALKFIGHAATSFASRGWHGNPFSTVWKMDSLLPTNFSRSFPRVYTRPLSLSLSLSLFSFFFFFLLFLALAPLTNFENTSRPLDGKEIEERNREIFASLSSPILSGFKRSKLKFFHPRGCMQPGSKYFAFHVYLRIFH